MTGNKSSKVPASRLSRVGHIGGLAATVMGRSLLGGASQLLQAKRPSIQNSVLTSENATSIAQQLSKMRGAAMKVGQMLSMDAGEFLPPQWEPILATLRAGADAMPKAQLLETLTNEWGANWPEHFEYFSFEPVAAASIGQVHKARLKSGETLAVKVQYPGVAQSIGSDINNVGRLLKMSGILPKDFNLVDLLAQAKQQLENEANYVKEAEYLSAYREHLQHDKRFVIPNIYQALSGRSVLCMQFIEGQPIDSVMQRSESERSAVITALFDLMLGELFEFQLMQSDPNFANYLYLPASQQIALLDFGACQHICEHNQTHYRATAQGMLEQDLDAIKAAMYALKLLHANMPIEVESAILNACLMASECLQEDAFNFKQTQLIKRIYGATQILINNKKAIQAPDFDTALINRKISGMVLFANKMACSLPLRELLVAKL
jgi:predicted unusual protein kinase regulating ubiquinone biosynthesis (AarF/ABC1/UbiB family)